MLMTIESQLYRKYRFNRVIFETKRMLFFFFAFSVKYRILNSNKIKLNNKEPVFRNKIVSFGISSGLSKLH